MSYVPNILENFKKSLLSLNQYKSPNIFKQMNFPGGYYYQTHHYVRPYENVRFDDAPEPIYGFTARTRQLFPCENDLSMVCTDLEAAGQVVECDQDRFRLVLYIVMIQILIILNKKHYIPVVPYKII